MKQEPLSRESQIKLMITAKQRHEDTAKRHMEHPQLRAAMARPAPGQTSKNDNHWYKVISPAIESAIREFGLARFKQTSMFLSNERIKEIYPF